jgi:hypothetical protein
VNPPFFYVQLRNGQPAIARAITTKESAPPWGLLGFRHYAENYFQIGDPELWQITGHWREDMQPHPFDILAAGNIVRFDQPSAAVPSNQAPLPVTHPAQENWIETAIRDYLKTHGVI